MVIPTDQTKLSISTKFVGRDVEIEELQDIYRQLRDETGPFARDESSKRLDAGLNTKAVYVKGLSGTGKSRLVTEALESIVGSNGYFCQGKFDQTQSLRPFSALEDALNDLSTKVMKDPEGNDEARRRIEILASQETMTAIVSVIPNMARYLPNVRSSIRRSIIVSELSQSFSLDDSIGSFARQPGVPERSQSFSVKSSSRVSNGSSTFGGSQQQVSPDMTVQFKIVFKKLVKALIGDRILVMFIDDLQWSEDDSVDLMEELIAYMPFRRFFFVGGFRSDEVKEGQYFSNFLEAATQASMPASILSIHQLTLNDITSFVADTLKLDDEERGAPLAELIHEKTKGNIFFVRQYIDFLYQNGHIFYDQQDFRWEWEDIVTIHDATTGASSIGEVVSKKILKLPRDTVDVLKLASCIGGRFDLDVIEYLAKEWWKAKSDNDPSSADAIIMGDVLWSAVEEGLLEEVCADPMSFTATLQYKFTHDKVQAASYNLIGDATTEYHLAIGQFLLRLYNASEDQKWLLVMVADHLYKGESIVGSQKDRDECALINLLAVNELEINAAFTSAAVYCQNAIHLLGENSFDRNYDLSLQIYNKSAILESYLGCKSASDERIATILEQARCLVDKHTAYYVQIRSCHQTNHFKEGAAAAYGLLRQMKVTSLPKKLGPVHIFFEMITVFRAVKRLSTEELMNKPTTEDQRVAQYTMFFMQALLCSLSSEPNMLCFLALRAVRVSLRFGFSAFTPTFFAFCGFLRLAITGNFQEADRIGRIGMRLSERFNAPQADVITTYVYYCGIAWTTSPMTNIPKWNKEIRALGFKCGDSGWGCIGGGAVAVAAYLYGTEPLDEVASMAAFYIEEMRVYDKLTKYDLNRALRQCVLNFLGRSKDPARMEGDEIKDLNTFEAALPSTISSRFVLGMRMILAQFFHDLDTAELLATTNMKTWKHDFPFFTGVTFLVHQCLIWSSLYVRDRKAKFRRRFKTAYTVVLGWSQSGSPNCEMFCLLLESVKRSTFDRCSNEEIRVAYEEAIRKNAGFGFKPFAAMAAERAGMHFASIPGQKDLVRSFLKTAIEIYQEWGATAKVRDICDRHAILLGADPILARASVQSIDDSLMEVVTL